MKKKKLEIQWKNKSGVVVAIYTIKFKNIYSSKEATNDDILEFKTWLYNNDYSVVSVI